MIGQETRDVERKITAILKILSESPLPLGSRIISRLLEEQGIYLGERAVRYHLKIMDERGFTRSVGHKDGRTITAPGLEEMRNSLVTDKIGFIGSRIERLAYQTSVGLRSATGRIPVDVSLFTREDLPRALKIMKGVFAAGLCSSNLVALAGENSKIGEMTVPGGKVGLATVCSVAVNGCLLKAGIPAYARFGGLLQVRGGQPFRFVDLIEFSGSTIEPADIFIAGKMTTVLDASLSGDGKVLAGYHEIPMLSINKAEELLQRLKTSGLISFAMIARPGEKICEIPFNPERVGLITLSGLNPVAAAIESGIEAITRAMAGLAEVTSLRPFTDLI
ncbi:MAG: NrpR regulatory domain-containing protein [Chloroflexi bacterium]|nr:NrpR regulatory domain-containing protein [Chloroflexota bacterium]